MNTEALNARIFPPKAVRRLPKVDLHRHLEGSFSPEMILEVAAQHRIPLPASTVEDLRPYVQVTDKDKTLLDFLKKFDTIALLFQTKEAVRELTYKVIEDANKDNLRYLELRFAPHYMQSKSPLSLDEITDAVLEGIERARHDFPVIRVEPILIAIRHLPPERAQEALELALRKGIRRFDLASDELNFPPELFCRVFQNAKAGGMQLTVHAGEARGADSIRTALECGADRIGHGVRITEDPALVEEVRKKRVPLELCPTSNVQTGAVPDLEQHPIRRLYDLGLNVTVNTDDPGVSGITLSHEYQLLLDRHRFTPEELKTVVLNGANAAFLPANEKELLAARIAREFKEKDVADTPLARRPLRPIPGCERLAYLPVTPEEVATPDRRREVASQMLSHLRRWPTLSAVISSAPNAEGNTAVIVAGPSSAAGGTDLRGVYDVARRLYGSASIKEAAKAYPVRFHAVRPFDSQGKTMTLRLPGLHDFPAVAAALREGGEPNQLSLVKDLVERLPKGKRVALLIGGPSGAGKTTLIEEIRKMAGSRKVVVLNGDMYFRDMDDPNYPRTAADSPYWDSPAAMHFEEMRSGIAALIRDGKARIPIYDFTAKVPGITNPNWKDTGKRVGYQNLELGTDDILVIDSLHATNESVIEKLTTAELPYAALYLDTPRTEDRLLRRIVRDYESRSAPPELTLQYWNLTTFPGEVEFIRPTLLFLDPARDVSYLTQGLNDLGLSKEAIVAKVKLFAEYGLAPTYPAFAAPDDRIEEFARREARRLEGVLASGSPSEKEKARLALDKMKAAPRADRIFQPAA